MSELELTPEQSKELKRIQDLMAAYDKGVADGRALEQRINDLEKILVRFAVIDSDAIYDPEGYDDGILMIRINRVKKYLLSKG